jgi:hypothetical protein
MDDNPTTVDGGIVLTSADTFVSQTISLQPTYWLTFGSSGISINCATGEVTIPEGLELTDAARAFWDEVRRIGGPPGFVA